MKKNITLIFVFALLILMLCGCSFSAVRKAEEAIDAIGTVSLESEGAIQAAKELYGALNEEKQAKVTNRNKLETAEIKLRELKVKNAETLIDQIAVESVNKKEKIDAARSAYDALDADSQAQVKNADELIQAEEMYEMLQHISNYMITDYQMIGTYKVSLFDLSAERWFGSNETAATAFVCFLLQGDKEHSISIDQIKFNTHICIDREDDRIDLFAKYRDNEILGIQYWPSESKAQVGTIRIDLEVKDYVELMIAGSVVDTGREIPTDVIGKVLNTMYYAASQ